MKSSEPRLHRAVSGSYPEFQDPGWESASGGPRRQRPQPDYPFKLWVQFLLDGARETLVLLRVVVLQADLQFDRFGEATLLLRSLGEDGVNRLVQIVTRHL